MRAAVAAAVLAALAGCGGSDWTVPVEGLDRAVLSVSGTGPRDVWFAGGGLGSGPGALAMRFDGAGFAEVPTGVAETLWWVFARASDDVWFCGEKGTILRWSGGAFARTPSGTAETLYGLWGASADDLWAVGGTPGLSSVALHWDGAAWSPAAGVPPFGSAYFKVWGSARDDVFIAGQQATILHFDGSAWRATPTGVDPRVTLFTVAGSGRGDAYAVGGPGRSVAIHWDGAAWGTVDGLTLDDRTSGLTGVFARSAREVVLVGLGGARLRRAGTAWSDDTMLPPREDFHAVWMSGPDDVFAVGGNYNSPKAVKKVGIIAHFGPAVPSARR